MVGPARRARDDRGRGLVLTFVLSYGVYDMEKREIWAHFSSLAMAKGHIVSRSFASMQRDLTNLGRTVAMHHPITESQFAEYAQSWSRLSGVQAVGWLPVVEAAQREKFEASMARAGFKNFEIHEPDMHGARWRPPDAMFLPDRLRGAAPGQRNRLGFDMGSDQLRGEAIEKSIDSGLPVAATPLAGGSGSASPPVEEIFQAVRDDNGRTVGLVACTLQLQNALDLMMAAGGRAIRSSRCTWSICAPTGRPRRWPRGRRHRRRGDAFVRAAGIRDDDSAVSFRALLAIVAHPSRQFIAEHQPWEGKATAAAGTLLTLILAGFVSFLRNARRSLQRLVELRTRQLSQR
jgi:hypothetical protein